MGTGPLSSDAIDSLLELALASTQGKPDETVAYSVLTQMFIEHQKIRPQSAFIICPQLRLPWRPNRRDTATMRPRDRRAILPDLGIGRILPTGATHLQTGAEQKRALIPLMQFLPDPALIIINRSLRSAIARAALQASDQVKAAIKNGCLPNNQIIPWIVAIGPYFIIRDFGPYSRAELDTRGHRPNDSGDANVHQEIAESLVHPLHIPETLHCIGTDTAAIAVDNCLTASQALYASDHARYDFY